MTCEELRNAWQTFVSIYQNERQHSDNPSSAVAYQCMEQMGRKQVLELLATVSKLKAKDGRISSENRAYLSKIPTNPEAVHVTAGNRFVYVNPNLDTIHTSYLDQIITEIRTMKTKRNE